MSLLEPGKSYTFSDIFKLKLDTDGLLSDLGYTLQRAFLTLPKFTGELDLLPSSQRSLQESLPLINLENETTRREMLIAPIVRDLLHYTQAKLRIEYALKVSDYLQGNLDYLLRNQTQLVVVEAKQADLDNGFNQLAVELIALDQWPRSPSVSEQPTFVGAVSTGTIWQLALLHRTKQLIQQDLDLFRVPQDLEDLQRVLIAALLPTSGAKTPEHSLEN